MIFDLTEILYFKNLKKKKGITFENCDCPFWVVVVREPRMLSSQSTTTLPKATKIVTNIIFIFKPMLLQNNTNFEGLWELKQSVGI